MSNIEPRLLVLNGDLGFTAILNMMLVCTGADGWNALVWVMFQSVAKLSLQIV